MTKQLVLRKNKLIILILFLFYCNTSCNQQNYNLEKLNEIYGYWSVYGISIKEEQNVINRVPLMHKKKVFVEKFIRNHWQNEGIKIKFSSTFSAQIDSQTYTLYLFDGVERMHYRLVYVTNEQAIGYFTYNPESPNSVLYFPND